MLKDDDIIMAEQQLLGSFFHDNKLLAEAINAGLEEQDFSNSLHSNVFNKISISLAQYNAFCVSDMKSISGNVSEDINVIDYVTQCVDALISKQPQQIIHYVGLLKEHRRKSFVLDKINFIRSNFDDYSSQEILQEIGNLFAENECIFPTIKKGETIFQEILLDFEEPPKYHATGIRELDRSMAGGLVSGYTYGIAGKEKSGKTTLASTISYNLNEFDCPHLYIALEMGSKEIEKRNLARRSNANSLSFRNPQKPFQSQIIKTKPSHHVHYLDAAGQNLDEIIQAITMARIKYRITGFILDYWQLVEGRQRGDTEEQHIRRVAQSLANYAKRNGLWCIILAQLNKDGDLFGGGGLKKACDQLFYIKHIEGEDRLRWLEMAASRYTPIINVGSEDKPSLILNQQYGPHFESLRI